VLLGAAPGVVVLEAGGLASVVEGVLVGGVAAVESPVVLVLEGVWLLVDDVAPVDDDVVVSLLSVPVELPPVEGVVADALADDPVLAIWPDHQSLDARCRGEAFR
jgi:hypothetical protein